MSAGAAGGASAVAQAIKASGAIVRVEPSDFQSLVSRQEAPLVVVAESRFFGTTYKYLMGYKGLAFYTQSSEPLGLTGRCELIRASRIWIPG